MSNIERLLLLAREGCNLAELSAWLLIPEREVARLLRRYA